MNLSHPRPPCRNPDTGWASIGFFGSTCRIHLGRISQKLYKICILNCPSDVIIRFASSQHVSEFKKESDGETLCIDGYFNNLNCLAVFLAHIIDSLHIATADECDVDGEESVAGNVDECAQASHCKVVGTN